MIAVHFRDFKTYKFDEETAIPLLFENNEDFHVFHISLVLENGYALLGELDKTVPVNVQRFGEITVTSNLITLQLNGVPGEIVNISFSNDKDL